MKLLKKCSICKKYTLKKEHCKEQTKDAGYKYVKLKTASSEQAVLQQRLSRLEADNAANPSPIQALFRLDAGFGTSENVALLIEMGYELYTKPFSHRVGAALRGRVTAETTWERVGANAEMVAWEHTPVGRIPYPLDVALERFHTGSEVRHSALLHYGDDPVTQDLGAWFQCLQRPTDD